MNKKYYVNGMHCAACEMFLEDTIADLNGIKKVDAKLKDKTVSIDSESPVDVALINSLINKNGYTISEEPQTKKTIHIKNTVTAFVLSSIIMLAFLLLQKMGVVNLIGSQEMTLPFVFFIGVIASLSTCMAVVGGIVLTLSSKLSQTQKVTPIAVFHASRILGFLVLGGLIGLVGSALILTPAMIFILDMILFIVMLLVGLNLLNIFDWTRHLSLKLPKSLGHKALSANKLSNEVLGAMLLGAGTFIIPCGFTQSMQLYSLTTGSFVNGALTMFVYALGTFPVLFLISFASMKFSKGLQSDLFFKTAGFLVIFFAFLNFVSALVGIGLVTPFINI